MTSLSAYFAHNYTENCAKNSQKSWIETPEFLSSAAKIIGIFGVPSNFFAYHLIIFHTPKWMVHLKLCLLHLKFWTLLIDLVYTVFLIPFVFYPIFAMGYIGIFSNWLKIPSEIQFYLAMCCYGGISSAGILIFENRQHYMIPRGHRFRIQNPAFRVVLVVFNAFLGGSVALVTFLLRSDSEELKFKFLKLNPCPDALYFSSLTFAVDTQRNELSVSIAVVLCLVTLEYTLFVTHCIFYIYSEAAVRYSRTTRKMQKMFLLASFSQLLIFLLVIGLPLTVFSLVLTTGYINQGLLNVCNLLIATIGSTSTVALVVMYKPYRAYFLSIFTREQHIEPANSVFSKSTVF